MSLILVESERSSYQVSWQVMPGSIASSARSGISIEMVSKHLECVNGSISIHLTCIIVI